MLYPNLGVNYLGSQATWANDKAYFNFVKNSGTQFPIRMQMTPIPIPWSASTPNPTGTNAQQNAYWRSAAAYFAADPNFYVIWGPNLGRITQANWSSIHTAMISEATYLVSQNLGLSEFQIGNEEEGTFGINFTIQSLTQSGGTATAVAAGAPNFPTGDTVTIYGASPSGYNGTFTVTNVNSTTFTYSVSSSLAPMATGSPECFDTSVSQLNVNLRQLATDIKAIPGWSGLDTSVSYGCFNNNVNGVLTYNDWIANGLGGLDFLSIHPYGVINNNTTIAPSGFAFVQEMITAFGNQCYLSEFNLDPTPSHLASLSPVLAVQFMNNYYSTYVLNMGVSKALLYAWTGTLNTTNNFAQLYMNGSTNPMWFDFFTSNPTQYSTGQRADVTRTSVNRTSVSRTSYPTRPLFQ